MSKHLYVVSECSCIFLGVLNKKKSLLKLAFVPVAY